MIPDSGCAEEREGALSSGEGDGLGVTASFSVSSLQTQTVRSVKPQNHREITPQIAKHTHTHARAPFVISQLLLQHEDFGLELVPLVEDVPQLLQGEAGSVGVLGVQAAPRLLVAQGLLRRRGERTMRGQ